MERRKNSSLEKISSAILRASKSCKVTPKEEKLEELKNEFSKLEVEVITVDKIHEIVGEFLDKYDPNVAKKYVGKQKIILRQKIL